MRATVMNGEESAGFSSRLMRNPIGIIVTTRKIDANESYRGQRQHFKYPAEPAGTKKRMISGKTATARKISAVFAADTVIFVKGRALANRFFVFRFLSY